jgi:predicted Zn-dependent protease
LTGLGWLPNVPEIHGILTISEPEASMAQLAVHGRPGGGAKVSRLLAGTLAVLLAMPPLPAFADERIATVSDAETEALLTDYLRPIVKAAGQQMPKIQLINQQAFNAFVTTGHRLFVNTGTIIQTKTPNELIGVLAHETGHIAHNDVARMQQAIDDTKTAMLLASIIGVGAGVAGSLAGIDSASAAGAGIVSGSSSIGMRSLLRYQREQEAAADRSAVDYLNKTGQSGAGMLNVLERLASDNLLIASQANPYLQSHPLPRERIATLEQLVRSSPNLKNTDPPALQLRHDLVRAKLAAFTLPPLQVARLFPISDQSIAAKYARAIVTYRSGRVADALVQIDGLLKTAPDDPYFWELKGQALLETGKAGQAVDPLRKAVALAPGAGLIKVLLGQALVALGGSANAQQAISLLSAAVANYPDLPGGYHALARAYAMVDNVPMAQLATAQGLFIEGDIKGAKIQAIRAQAKLKSGSPAWLRADDIASYKPQK